MIDLMYRLGTHMNPKYWIKTMKNIHVNKHIIGYYIEQIYREY